MNYNKINVTIITLIISLIAFILIVFAINALARFSTKGEPNVENFIIKY